MRHHRCLFGVREIRPCILVFMLARHHQGVREIWAGWADPDQGRAGEDCVRRSFGVGGRITNMDRRACVFVVFVMLMHYNSKTSVEIRRMIQANRPGFGLEEVTLNLDASPTEERS